MPVMIIETATYNTAQTAKEPIMPMGRSRAGFFTSSAAEETASKPIKAKKTKAEAFKIPWPPKGAKGCQLAG
ncbi:hypothetical protein D3C85_1739060 [compost metagenome]